MSIMQRHVVVEVTKVFLVTLAATTALMLLVGLIRVAVDYGLGLAQILPALPYLLPEALRFAIPGALLLAVCNVYGRLSASNELDALQGLGISLRTVIWPALALATLVSLGTVFLNDEAVCWGHDGIERQATTGVVDIVYSVLRSRGNFTSPQLSIAVAAVEGRLLIAPEITLAATAKQGAVQVSARNAELSVDAETSELRIICRDCTLTTDRMSATFPNTFEQRLPLDAARQKSRSTAPAWIPLRQIPAEMARREEQIEARRHQLAATAAFSVATGELAALATPHWQEEYQQLDHDRGYVYRLRTEPPRRWASGFSCLGFVLVGLPLAIRLRTRDFLTTFFLCFLPILVVYYPLLAYGITAAKNGTLWPAAVWTGNLAAAGCGAYLLRPYFRR